MLRLCYRAFLLCWLACWGHLAVAQTSLDKDRLGLSERLWLASRCDLVVGMPSVAWPPYVYANSRGGSVVRWMILPLWLQVGWD